MKQPQLRPGDGMDTDAPQAAPPRLIAAAVREAEQQRRAVQRLPRYAVPLGVVVAALSMLFIMTLPIPEDDMLSLLLLAFMAVTVIGAGFASHYAATLWVPRFLAEATLQSSAILNDPEVHFAVRRLIVTSALPDPQARSGYMTSATTEDHLVEDFLRRLPRALNRLNLSSASPSLASLAAWLWRTILLLIVVVVLFPQGTVALLYVPLLASSFAFSAASARIGRAGTAIALADELAATAPEPGEAPVTAVAQS
jgi:hypothetical protein